MLIIAFPNFNPKMDATFELWETIFDDMPGQTLKAAIMQCLVEPNRAFAPSIGEIRGTALRLNAKASGIPEAWQAYEEVRKMPKNMQSCQVVEENGQNFIEYRELKFSHQLVAQVADLVGWPDAFPTDMPAADRSQFIKAYEAELGRVMEDAGRLKLVSDYISQRRSVLGGDALAIAAKITKRLEVKQ
jgi:hypothetical protein